MRILSVIIVNFNTKKLTLDCLDSVLKSKTTFEFELLVVDNNSTDGSVEAIKKFYPQVRLIQSSANLGFGGGNNLGINQIHAKYYLLLNSDTLLEENSIENLYYFAKGQNLDIASCKITGVDGKLQPNTGHLPTFLPLLFWLTGLDDLMIKVFSLPSYHTQQPKFYQGQKEVGWVSGTVMLIKMDVFKTIGYFDDNIFMYAEDVDFCWRAKLRNFKIGWTEGATVYHLGGGSQDKPHFRQWSGEFKNLIYLYQKYYGLMASISLRLLIYLFASFRIIAFTVAGRKEYAKTYAKVIGAI